MEDYTARKEMFGVAVMVMGRVLALGLACVLGVGLAGAQVRVDEGASRVSFPEGRIAVELRVSGAGGPGTVVAELLDPSDVLLAKNTASCGLQVAGGVCLVELPVNAVGGFPGGERSASLLRVRYSVKAAGGEAKGVVALGQVAPSLYELYAVTPKSVRAGASYTVQVRAMHPATGLPRAGVVLSASVEETFSEDKDRVFKTARLTTNAEGFAVLEFEAPRAGSPQGKAMKGVRVRFAGVAGSLRPALEKEIEVPVQSSIVMTTDKPLYQPGQTVHVRVLAVDERGAAKANAAVVMEVRDPDSTLVARLEAKTSKFGIASADWAIPARLRLGSYMVALKDNDDYRNRPAQIRISRYDLPTFVVVPKPDRPYYLPGQNAAVEVRADYLFGKPVLRGHVRVVREDGSKWNEKTQKSEVVKGAVVEGEMGAGGSFTAKLDLSADEKNYAEESENGNAYEDLHYAAYVTDGSTQRTEQRKFDVRVSAKALHVQVRREGEDAAGLPVGFYVEVETADGAPAAGAEVRVALMPRVGASDSESLKDEERRGVELRRVVADKNGIAWVGALGTYAELVKRSPAALRVDFEGGEDDGPRLLVSGRMSDGREGAVVQSWSAGERLLRMKTNQTLYKVGDPLEVTVESARGSLPVMVQVSRQTHGGLVTLATQSVVLRDGRAKVSFATDGKSALGEARFAGYCTVSVVALGADVFKVPRYQWGYVETSPVVSRMVLFPRETQLGVKVKMSRDVFKPGETATAEVQVTGPQDQDGDDTSKARMALGAVVIDQAVAERNRTDSEFGSGSSFYFPWRSTFLNTGSVAGVWAGTLEGLDAERPFPEGMDRAAAVVLQSGQEALETVTNAASTSVEQVYSRVFDAELKGLRGALEKFYWTRASLPTTAEGLDGLLVGSGVSVSGIRDPWGMAFKIESETTGATTVLKFLSAGPDKRFGTRDDVRLEVASSQWFVEHRTVLQRVMQEQHRRTGGFIRDLAGLTEAMRVSGVDFGAWRDPWGRPLHWEFPVRGVMVAVAATSDGPDGRTSERFEAGAAEISWFTDIQAKVNDALNAYARKHAFPMDERRFEEALRLSGLSVGQFVDPWGRPVFAKFKTRSVFTDRVTSVDRAKAGEAPKTKVTITPVTAVIDVVEIWSTGVPREKDDAREYDRDELAGAFSHVRSMESAKDGEGVADPATGVVPGRRGQESGGVTGTVMDATGAVVAKAKVVLTSDVTKAEVEAETNVDGAYAFEGLAAGTYTLRVQAPGFQTTVFEQVTVLPPDFTVMDAKLAVGTVNDMVTVTAESVVLNTSSASLAIATYGYGMPGGIFGGVAGGSGSGPRAMLMRVAPPPPPVAMAGSTPAVRQYFPETLLWRPEVLTDEEGRASLRFPVADSITQWTLMVSASTLKGNTGGGGAAFRTMLPFFAALEPPQTLTVGDRIALPVAMRNYLDHAVTVRSEVAAAPWLRVESMAKETVVAAQDSASPVLQMVAVAPVGQGKLRLTAKVVGEAGDAIERVVAVHPDGQEKTVTAAGIVHGAATLNVEVPQGAVLGADAGELKLYPNLASHLREALDAVGKHPGSCAEQITSGAWPSLLLQQYGARFPGTTGATSAMTKKRLEEAYASLLEDREADGGFKYWAGDARADVALTAYVVRFLTEAKAFIAVDENVIHGAVAYLQKQQTKEGMWVPVGRDGKVQTGDTVGTAMLTATVTSMIAESADAEPLLRLAVPRMQEFVERFDEPYTLASYALASVAMKDDARTKEAVTRLRAMALSENGGAYWKIETNTPFFGWGRAGRVESTSQVLRALLAAGASANDDLVVRGMMFLEHEQDRDGIWYSTQATARALDVVSAIALSGEAAGTSAGAGRYVVKVDGREVASAAMPQAGIEAGPVWVPLGDALGAGSHAVGVEIAAGSEPATAQVVARFYEAWPKVMAAKSVVNNEGLRMRVGFDTTAGTAGTMVHAKAHVERVGFRGYGMLIAEVGLPPGADVDRASLESAVEKSGYVLNHYEVLPDRVLVYLWPQAGGYDLEFAFTLRYGVDALTAPSTVYDYYNPDAHADVAPTRFVSAH